MRRLNLFPAVALALWAGGCAPAMELLAGPDPATYQPNVEVLNPLKYATDEATCRQLALRRPGGFSAGAVVTAGTKAAIGNAPAAAASAPLYIGEIGAQAGQETINQLSGSRAPKLRGFVKCLYQATTRDGSALMADDYE